MRRPNHHGFRRLQRCEGGFTLGEVLITIVLMGIVFAIASSTWFNVVEGRRVDSAANQLAADLRVAHSTATNRLAPQAVSLTAGSNEYTMTGSPGRDLDDDPNRNLVTVDTTVTITFRPDGSAEPAGAPITFRVSSADDANMFHDIEIRPETSRVQIDP